MYRTPKNVELKTGTLFTVLGKSDILLGTDLVRITIQYDFHEESEMNWQFVMDSIPAWEGRTLNDYEKFSNSKCYYEVIRIVKLP